MVGACADVSDFCYPILCKLMLYPEVPLHNSRHATHGASGSHDTAGMTWVCKKDGWRKARGYQLVRRRRQKHIEGAGCKRQLRWVQTEVIEDVALARIEDTEGTVDDRILQRRPCQTDSRRPIALIELNAGMGYGIRSIRIHHNRTIQVEVPNAAIGGRGHLIAQANVQRKGWPNVVVILHELRQVPITCRIHSC